MGVKTTNNIKKRLDILVKRTSDLKVPLKLIAEEMRKDVRKNFDNERSYLGVKWKKSFRAKKDGGKTLQDTGRLYNSFTKYSNNEVARVGTNVKYARLLNNGAKKGELWNGEVTVKSHYRKIKGKKIKIKSYKRRGIAPWGDVQGYQFLGINKKMISKYKKILFNYILKK